MRIVELCAGYGGLGLGVKIAIPSARVVGIVERQAYAVARWQELMEAEAVEPVAIWPDVESFAWAMAARNRKRLGLQLPQCDMLTAGFPCQPFSQAGKRHGVRDERWIWPAIRRAVGVLEPRYVFLENVPGILNSGGFGRVLGDLSALGFDAEWDVIPAADAGANHFRFRVFIFAWRRDDANAGSIAGRAGLRAGESRRKRRRRRGDVCSAADAQHALCERCGRVQEHQGEQAAGRGRDQAADATDAADVRGGAVERSSTYRNATGGGEDDAADAKLGEGVMGRHGEEWRRPHAAEQAGVGDPSDATGRRLTGGGESPGSAGLATGGEPDDGHAASARLEERPGLRPRGEHPDPAIAPPERRHAEPAPGGVDDGATAELGQGWWDDWPYPSDQWLSRDEPDRAEQLHALGNGVIPLQAALALTLLARRAGVTL